MLLDFLQSNRAELIRTCRSKASSRFAPAETPDVIDHGVPLFIQQLIDALKLRPSTSPTKEGVPGQIPFPPEIGRSAALHGAELLRRGFTVDEVVHDYGDVCQAITEMAIEKDRAIDPDDFRIFNGCLDNAIAGAVTAFANGHQKQLEDLEDERDERLSVLRDEHRRLVEIAIQAFTAMKTGSLGMAGATGALLMYALTELRALSDRPLGEDDKAEATASLRVAAKRDKAP